MALGVLLSDLPGRLGEAVSEFEEAARLKPDSATVQFCLGVGLARRGMREEAARHLREALSIRPDFIEARNALGHLISPNP